MSQSVSTTIGFVERFLRKKLKGGVFGDIDPVRSRTMSKIRSRGNKSTETRLRMGLVRCGVKGWEMHSRNVSGTPDFYFRKHKLAVFVDGCFWHGCIKCGHIPKTRTAFWSAKFKRNKARARKVRHSLSRQGIEVMRFWEHDVKKVEPAVRAILKVLRKRP